MNAPLIASLTPEALAALLGRPEGHTPLRLGFIRARVSEAASE